MAKILYIGRFELPDKEATANRVVANAKLLRELGHEVVLAGWSDGVSATAGWQSVECYGFESYEKHKAKTSYEKYRMFADASPELSLLEKHKPDLLIAYDFPAVALKKIMKYCRAFGIKVVCDVSEWYTNSNKNPFFRIVRAYDSHLRMRVLHKRADGLIVISRFLQNYYSKQKTVLVPPLVDISDEKWQIDAETPATDGKIKLIYAGWPSKTKERLDVIVDAVKLYQTQTELDIYGITEQNYRRIYEYSGEISENVHFHGRVSHRETVAAVKGADYAVIIRESCRKNNAGFPSKLVECITVRTPALITDISNVKDYVGNGKNGYIVGVESFAEDLKKILLSSEKACINEKQFDYHEFSASVSEFLGEVM